jgi:hypothetical protein
MPCPPNAAALVAGKMNVDYEAISELFRLDVIDGLTSSGAPDDEYKPEVEQIVAALEAVPRDEACGTVIADIIGAVRLQMCGGINEQTKRRRFDIDEIAERVMRIS